METLVKHKTKCVFCACDLMVDIDQACPGGRLVKLLPIAACNRCGDFRHSVRPIEDTIKRVCEELDVSRQTKRRDLGKMEAGIRNGLITLTKNLMYRLCKFYRVANDWDVSLPQMFFDKPQDWKAILTMNENGIRKAKQLPHMPKPIPEEVRKEPEYCAPYPDE